jgi:glycosyltransferase involved in cell wall biosynthesis
MVKLSIIIPHWNCYNLLEKLLDELSIQFITDDVEIIVVDDSNEERLDEYTNIANIIHNEQRVGLSKARNIGLDLAKGKYVAFIDADDMVTNDYMEVLLKAIDEHDDDIILFNWADFNENVIIRHPENYAVWKAIYKKDICPHFYDDQWYNEDVFFQEELNKQPHSVYFIDRVLYIYNSNRIGSNMWERNNK